MASDPPRTDPVKRARGQEVIRQWKLLNALQYSKFGKTVDELAKALGVTTRTIRRDLAQLQEVGFPLEQKGFDSRRAWVLNAEVFSGLAAAGLTLPELCALYFSKALMEYLAGTPFRDDLRSAFDKFTDGLTSAQWKYLETLPRVLVAKPEPRKKAATESPAHVSRLTTAALERRRVEMTYHSFRSRQVKRYVIEPHQVYYAQGGLYVFAGVPAYGETRQFAVERIKSLKMTEEHFEAELSLDASQLADSLGVNLGGRPEVVTIEFQPDAAPYVSEREYHPTQQIEEKGDGRVVLKMKVVVDFALSAWVLSFGRNARVVGPPRLVSAIHEQIEEMRELYAPPLPEVPPRRRARGQSGLPFTSRR
jgi:predicted DNA-binding transcriptional regulator YafY